MVHSACQCDSVTGLGTDIWPNVILDASICQMFLGEINTWISGLSKQMPSLTWEELHPIIWRTGWNSNGGKRNSCLTAELGHGSFPTFGLEFGIDCTPSSILLLRPSDSNWSYITASSGSLACEVPILEPSQPLYLCEPIPDNKSLYKYIHTYILLVLFPWRTLIQRPWVGEKKRKSDDLPKSLTSGRAKRNI